MKSCSVRKGEKDHVRKKIRKGGNRARKEEKKEKKRKGRR